MRIEFPADSPQAGQIVIETPRERLHYFPDANEVHVMPVRLEEVAERLGMLLRQNGRELTITTTPGSDVAALPTVLVSVSDKRGNVIQKMWIHPRTGLLLKRDLFDPIGSKVGSFEFRTVNLNPDVKDDDFKIRRQGVKFLNPRDLLRRFAKEAGLAPMALPERDGVQLESTRVMRVDKGTVLVQTYQTRLGPLSFFQTKMEINPERFRRLASRDSFKSFAWDQNGVTFALVGNHPEDFLKRLARQVSEPEP
jgi:hypothetical protein